MTHRRSGLLLRASAVALLLFGVAGGAYLGQEREHRADGAAASEHAATVSDEAQLLERLTAAYERADRRRRQAVADEAARREAAARAESQRVSRADQAAASPPAPATSAPLRQPEPRPGPPAPDVPDSCEEYTGNRATGCALLLEAGFALDHMSCLDSLWTRESGWDHRAQNPSSGAYGIPQALPGDKMAAYGDDWRTNPATQIRWGLDYIDNRYGTPCNAWSFFQANNWY